MSFIAPKTVPMFHFTGDKATTPACPVDVQPNLNSSSTVQSYQSSDADCKESAKFKIPFFALMPTYEEWSVNAHEAMPGHHLQVNNNNNNNKLYLHDCKFVTILQKRTTH